MANRRRPKKEEKKGAKKENKKEVKTLRIPPIELGTMVIPIYGVSTLVVDRVPPHVVDQLRAKILGVPYQPKKLSPREMYLGSYYYWRGKHYFPAQAFYKSALKACSSLKGVITKEQAKQAHRVVGEWVEIKGKPKMREDLIRPEGRSGINLKFRSGYEKWSTRLLIKYNKNMIFPSEILNLYNTAGFATGVGCGRPGCKYGGSNGMFSVSKK